MARKQKKLTRKQRLQQQEAVARQRQARGWISPNERAKQRQELVEDMAPLLAIAETGAGSEEENLFFLLADSGDLIEEAEFEAIFAEPLVTLPTYISVAEKLGFPSPDDLFNLPEEEQSEKKAEIMEETTRRLLTDELRQEILVALNGLRLRWKKEGQRAEAARAAGLQLILNDRKSKGLWSTIGLVQAIVLRSLEAGFELVGVTVDEESEEADEDRPLSDLYKRLNEPEVTGKLEEAIKKVPGLEDYLDKQLDKIWEEGDEALFRGELNLGLFTTEELEAGAKIFNQVMREQAEDEKAADSTKEQTQKLFTQLNAYLVELFTPERLEQLRARLHTILEEGVYPGRYFSYVKMMTEAMAEEDAAENERPFLFKALLGELQTTLIDEADDEEGGEEEES
ncbi:MAG: hypothetical protein DPW09_09215 [Anaerolineae bacterium]|nr:hypothetical protein [Anaerolineales bacterium]MCQ3973608.1 hypothetical protein [Anaerolineae bacterium]